MYLPQQLGKKKKKKNQEQQQQQQKKKLFKKDFRNWWGWEYCFKKHFLKIY